MNNEERAAELFSFFCRAALVQAQQPQWNFRLRNPSPFSPLLFPSSYEKSVCPVLLLFFAISIARRRRGSERASLPPLFTLFSPFFPFTRDRIRQALSLSFPIKFFLALAANDPSHFSPPLFPSRG